MTPKALRPYVIKITGPLIRVVGDRFQWQVKSAILGTLTALLKRVGSVLRPFVPQLQTTFVKALRSKLVTHLRRRTRHTIRHPTHSPQGVA